jgi:hypothetical protein
VKGTLRAINRQAVLTVDELKELLLISGLVKQSMVQIELDGIGRA